MIMGMLHTADIDTDDMVSESDIADFLTNATWAIRSTYHIVLNLPGAAIFGRDMLFDIPFLADWSKIGEYRQKQTDKNIVKENSGRVDWDYHPGDKELVINKGILCKSESQMTVNLGLSCQFIQMAQYGFKAE